MFTFFRTHRHVNKILKKNSAEPRKPPALMRGKPNRLREFREAKDWTLKDLAGKTGKDFRTISQYESGERPIPEEFLQKAAKELEVSAELICSAGAQERLNDPTEARSKDSHQMHEASLQSYRAALLWLASHLDDAHLHRLREAVWNEPESSVPRSTKLLVFDALMASREKQQRQAVPKN